MVKDFSVRHIFLVVVAMFIHPRSGLLANDSDRQRLNEIAESLASHAVAQGVGAVRSFSTRNSREGTVERINEFFYTGNTLLDRDGLVSSSGGTTDPN